MMGAAFDHGVHGCLGPRYGRIPGGLHVVDGLAPFVPGHANEKIHAGAVVRENVQTPEVVAYHVDFDGLEMNLPLDLALGVADVWEDKVRFRRAFLDRQPACAAAGRGASKGSEGYGDMQAAGDFGAC